MSERVGVRAARAGDAPALAALSTSLGYPATAGEIEARLRVLERSDGDAVFVAVDDEDAPIGFVHVAARDELVVAPCAKIEGLDVGEAFRRRGAATGLIEAVEAWAAARGLGVVMVRSRTERAAAHAFYSSLGYEVDKRQTVFRKRLAA